MNVDQINEFSDSYSSEIDISHWMAIIKKTSISYLGALQRKKIPNIRDYYGSGWVGPGLTQIFFWGKIFPK